MLRPRSRGSLCHSSCVPAGTGGRDIVNKKAMNYCATSGVPRMWITRWWIKRRNKLSMGLEFACRSERQWSFLFASVLSRADGRFSCWRLEMCYSYSTVTARHLRPWRFPRCVGLLDGCRLHRERYLSYFLLPGASQSHGLFSPSHPDPYPLDRASIPRPTPVHS